MCFSLIHLQLWTFLSHIAPEYLTPACSRQQESLTRHNFNGWCDKMKQPRRHFFIHEWFYNWSLTSRHEQVGLLLWKYLNITETINLTQSSDIKQVANTFCLPFWDFNRTTSFGLRRSIYIISYKGMHYLQLSVSSHCLVFWNRSCSLKRSVLHGIDYEINDFVQSIDITLTKLVWQAIDTREIILHCSHWMKHIQHSVEIVVKWRLQTPVSSHKLKLQQVHA
jgi:hypothetical protein